MAEQQLEEVSRQIEMPRRRAWRRWSWLLLAGAIVLGYALAVWYGKEPWERRLFDALGLLPGFPGYEADRPWQYTLARHLVALATLLVTARVVIALLGDRFAELRARFRRHHAVVAGLGETGLRSARAFLAAGYRVTCLELIQETDTSADARALGALVLRRDATQVVALEDARADRADFVVCSCGDDAVNSKIASLVVALAHSRPGAGPTIHVEIGNPDLARLLRAPLAAVGAARLHFFNTAAVWARALLDAASGPFARLGSVPPQLVVLGATNLGTAVAIEAARRWHRHSRSNGVGARAGIVVVGPGAADACSALSERYPAVPRVCDLMPVERPFGTGLPLTIDGEADAAYVCLDDQSANLALALEAEQVLPEETRVFLPARAAAGMLAPLLFGGGKLSAVALPDDADSIDLLHDHMRDSLARQGHEAYLAERRGRLDFGSRKADHDWDELDADSRRSNYAHVDAMIEQLAAVWYEIEPLYDWDASPAELTDDAVEAMAELEHARWCRERRSAGWTYDPHRDDTRKRHDQLVDWADLPEEPRELVRAMTRRRPAILADAGYRLARSPAREVLAKRLHERYVAARAEAEEDAPLAVPWEELDEEARDYNRASVDHIAVKLARIGCRAAPRAAGAVPRPPFTSEEVELMARAEHERWLAERVAAGWRLGPRDEERSHPSLVPWEELPESERQKDRDVVSAIPSVLAEAGQVVVRDG